MNPVLRAVLGIFYVVGATASRAYFIMLGIGIMHAEWWNAMPTMSYKVAFAFVLLVGGSIGMLPTFDEVIAKSQWIKRELRDAGFN